MAAVIPTTMTAIEIRAPGAPEVLQPVQRPVPGVGAREVLVRVVAAGVNRPDVLQRQGHFPPPQGTTDIPGLEVAGEIVRVGAEVKEFAVGDQVCALVAGGGADHAINYREEDFVAATLRLTDGNGADVILDMVGGSYVPRNIAAAATNGRLAIIATLGGPKADVDLRVLMSKRLTITASTLRAQPVENKGRLAAALRETVWPLFSTKRLRPLIHARFPLAQASAAHALMESDRHIGKIVLTT